MYEHIYIIFIKKLRTTTICGPSLISKGDAHPSLILNPPLKYLEVDINDYKIKNLTLNLYIHK